jgi:hypothetical protein
LPDYPKSQGLKRLLHSIRLKIECAMQSITPP